MSAAALVRRAVATGIVLKVKEESLVVSAAARPDESLLEELRTAKPIVVEYLRGLALWSEEDWSALYDERAGIMEFDGGLSRAKAETAAANEVDGLRALAGRGDG